MYFQKMLDENRQYREKQQEKREKKKKEMIKGLEALTYEKRLK